MSTHPSMGGLPLLSQDEHKSPKTRICILFIMLLAIAYFLPSLLQCSFVHVRSPTCRLETLKVEFLLIWLILGRQLLVCF